MSMTRVRRRDDGVTVQILDDGSEVPIVSQTDWARVEAMIDEQSPAPSPTTRTRRHC